MILSYSSHTPLTLQTFHAWTTQSTFPRSDGWFSALPHHSGLPSVFINKVRSEAFMRTLIVLIVLISTLHCLPDPNQRDSVIPDPSTHFSLFPHVRDEELLCDEVLKVCFLQRCDLLSFILQCFSPPHLYIRVYYVHMTTGGSCRLNFGFQSEPAGSKPYVSTKASSFRASWFCLKTLWCIDNVPDVSVVDSRLTRVCLSTAESSLEQGTSPPAVHQN